MRPDSSLLEKRKTVSPPEPQQSCSKRHASSTPSNASIVEPDAPAQPHHSTKQDLSVATSPPIVEPDSGTLNTGDILELKTDETELKRLIYFGLGSDGMHLFFDVEIRVV